MKDMQGKDLKVGDKVAFLAYYNANSLTIGFVHELKKSRTAVVYEAFGETQWETVRANELVKL